tara:strand:- start:196935 stop:197090 length:156 start_codon:yes stop_codon:yes gene_type:complete
MWQRLPMLSNKQIKTGMLIRFLEGDILEDLSCGIAKITRQASKVDIIINVV